MSSEATATSDEIWQLSAAVVVDLLGKGALSPIDVLECLERRVAEVNPVVNALPTLCFDRAYDRAKKMDLRDQLSHSLLAGLPLVIKDSISVQGVRTTYGSRVFKDYVPEESDAVVLKIESNGGLVYAKSNTPEFEAGANTYNEVFGATRNPWNTSLSAGGSSGGAAVSVATGMAWLAQGTDFACSLRNPAGFNNVVGLRPSIGVVPQGPNNVPFQTLSVSGPIARTVADCGLFLDAMAGSYAADPFSSNVASGVFSVAAQSPTKPIRVGFSLDLGLSPVDPSVRVTVTNAIKKLAMSGVDVIETYPDMSGAHEAFRTLRALQFATAWGHLLPEHRDVLKADVVWNIEEGQNLTSGMVIKAERQRLRIRRNILEVLQQYDALILPTSIVPPYPLTQGYVSICDGVEFDNYLEWMAISYAITLTGCPSISIPGGFTKDGLPVGLQIVSASHTDAKLLSIAAFVESELGFSLKKPITPPIFKTTQIGAL